MCVNVMRVDHVVVLEIRMVSQTLMIFNKRSFVWHGQVGQPRVVVRLVHRVHLLINVLWMDGLGHVQVLAF